MEITRNYLASYTLMIMSELSVHVQEVELIEMTITKYKILRKYFCYQSDGS